jgi:hypothetical protein
LTGIEIGNSVTSIGDEAFSYCSSLTKITCLATNPPAIYSNTFSNYDADLYVPAGCISAYQSAYYWKNFNIKEIVILSTSIALNQTTATLKATETLTLVATVLPENTTDKSVTWKSSNEAVATVDANGKVTAVAVGMMLGFFTGDDDNVTLHGSGNVLELRDQNVRIFRSQPQLLGGKGDDSFLNQGVGIELFFHFGGAVGAAQVFHYVYLFDHGCPPIN